MNAEKRIGKNESTNCGMGGVANCELDASPHPPQQRQRRVVATVRRKKKDPSAPSSLVRSAVGSPGMVGKLSTRPTKAVGKTSEEIAVRRIHSMDDRCTASPVGGIERARPLTGENSSSEASCVPKLSKPRHNMLGLPLLIPEDKAALPLRVSDENGNSLGVPLLDPQRCVENASVHDEVSVACGGDMYAKASSTSSIRLQNDPLAQNDSVSTSPHSPVQDAPLRELGEESDAWTDDVVGSNLMSQMTRLESGTFSGYGNHRHPWQYPSTPTAETYKPTARGNSVDSWAANTPNNAVPSVRPSSSTVRGSSAMAANWRDEWMPQDEEDVLILRRVDAWRTDCETQQRQRWQQRDKSYRSAVRHTFRRLHRMPEPNFATTIYDVGDEEDDVAYDESISELAEGEASCSPDAQSAS